MAMDFADAPTLASLDDRLRALEGLDRSRAQAAYDFATRAYATLAGLPPDAAVHGLDDSGTLLGWLVQVGPLQAEVGADVPLKVVGSLFRQARLDGHEGRGRVRYREGAWFLDVETQGWEVAGKVRDLTDPGPVPGVEDPIAVAVAAASSGQRVLLMVQPERLQDAFTLLDASRHRPSADTTSMTIITPYTRPVHLVGQRFDLVVLDGPKAPWELKVIWASAVKAGRALYAPAEGLDTRPRS